MSVERIIDVVCIVVGILSLGVLFALPFLIAYPAWKESTDLLEKLDREDREEKARKKARKRNA